MRHFGGSSLLKCVSVGRKALRPRNVLLPTNPLISCFTDAHWPNCEKPPTCNCVFCSFCVISADHSLTPAMSVQGYGGNAGGGITGAIRCTSANAAPLAEPPAAHNCTFSGISRASRQTIRRIVCTSYYLLIPCPVLCGRVRVGVILYRFGSTVIMLGGVNSRCLSQRTRIGRLSTSGRGILNHADLSGWAKIVICPLPT